MRILRHHLNEIPLLGISGSTKTNYRTIKRVGYTIGNGEINRQATNIVSRRQGVEENPSIIAISIRYHAS